MNPHPLDTALGPWRALVGLVIATLPRRIWNAWEGRVPVAAMALPAALVPLFLGFAIAIPAFIDYAAVMATTIGGAVLEAGHQVNTGQKPPAAPVHVWFGMMVALPAFFFFTRLGWVCTYLIGSGLGRLLGWAADDPRGDPIVAGVDALARRWTGEARAFRERSKRHALEGPEVADVLVRGRAVGAADAVYAVIASRLKSDWQPGVLLVTEQGRYRVGVAFDRTFAEGLRAVYPLLEVAAVEVTRRAFPCALPPLSEFDPVTRRAEPPAPSGSGQGEG